MLITLLAVGQVMGCVGDDWVGEGCWSCWYGLWIKWSRMKTREVDDTEGPGKLEGVLLVRIHRYGGGDAVGAEEGSGPEH